MLTKAFYCFLSRIFVHSSVDIGMSCKDVNGNVVSNFVSYDANYGRQIVVDFPASGNMQTSSRFNAGGGGSAPTINDYKLEAAFDNVDAVSFESGEIDGHYFGTVSLTVSNPETSKAITIREVGYFCYFNSPSSKFSSGYDFHLFLIDRTLLDEPITLSPGEHAVIKYKILNKFDWS